MQRTGEALSGGWPRSPVSIGIRYTTSHPRDMDGALDRGACCEVDALMPYLHLPVQGPVQIRIPQGHEPGAHCAKLSAAD